MAEDNPELQHALQELDRELEVRYPIRSFSETYTDAYLDDRKERLLRRGKEILIARPLSVAPDFPRGARRSNWNF